MNNIILLYQSKYGSTRKYAQWLSEELSCDLAETKKFSAEQLEKYDVVILGGGVYASGILGISFLKKHRDKLKGKAIAVFAVGASPYEKNVVDRLKKRNLPGELSGIPCFYCRGAWHESKMSAKDRLFCNLLKKAVTKKDPNSLEPWASALMQASGSDFDWTDRQSLKPIVDFVRHLQKS